MSDPIRDAYVEAAPCRDGRKATTGARGVASKEKEMTDIFVFGSNLAGRHGAGAAKYALEKKGAVLFQGEGLQGTSYGIATKDERIRTRGLVEIERSVMEFLRFAESRPDLTFDITPIGCGLAGYKRSQIEPLFAGMPPNCRFNPSWDEHID